MEIANFKLYESLRIYVYIKMSHRVILFRIFSQIFGVVISSTITTPGASWSPPSNTTVFPPLVAGNYVKINHIACVANAATMCPVDPYGPGNLGK